jgi:hypothetical protein
MTSALFPALPSYRTNPDCVWIQRGDFNDCVHNAGGRGQLFEDCCESCRLLILRGIFTLGEALSKHDQWCGHFKDAPGDGIVNRATDADRWMGDWARYQASRLEQA